MWTTYPHLWQSHADPDGDSYSHATATATPRYADSYSHGHGYGNRYADSYCGTASNSDTAAAADTGASPVGRSGSEKMIID